MYMNMNDKTEQKQKYKNKKLFSSVQRMLIYLRNATISSQKFRFTTWYSSYTPIYAIKMHLRSKLKQLSVRTSNSKN